MISASKSTLSLNNLKILRPKVTKILQIRLRSFVKNHPVYFLNQIKYFRTWFFRPLSERPNWMNRQIATSKTLIDGNWSLSVLFTLSKCLFTFHNLVFFSLQEVSKQNCFLVSFVVICIKNNVKSIHEKSYMKYATDGHKMLPYF
jgi:hypothetical protein